MSQNAQVLMHLESGQPITQLEATMKYGILRLSERVRELEAVGCVINHERVSVPTRNGKKATVVRYSLISGIPDHKETDQCGFDRNGSHNAGTYVCGCGWGIEMAA
jgi:hypothetical protein